MHGSLNAIYWLLLHDDVNVGIVDNDGYTAIHYLFVTCCKNNNHKYKGVLFSNCMVELQNRDPYVIHYRNSNNGNTIFHDLAYNVTRKSVNIKTFIKNCLGFVNHVNVVGKTPMHIVCEGQNIEALQYLKNIKTLQHNVLDARGKTALHYLCQHPWNFQCIELYFSLTGINFEVVDFDNNTALHCMIQGINVTTEFDFLTPDYCSIIKKFVRRAMFVLVIKNNNNQTIQDVALLKLNESTRYGFNTAIQTLQRICAVIDDKMLILRNGIYKSEMSNCLTS
jgi:ankyrin repeat protein